MRRPKPVSAFSSVFATLSLLATSPLAFTASGTVKSNKGDNLADVTVSVKDSANLKTTTNTSGAFTLSYTLGVQRGKAPVDYSAQMMGNQLLISFPGEGTLELDLVDLSGASLWSGRANLLDGHARADLPATTKFGPAILRIAHGSVRVSQPITLLGPQGASLTPRFSARTLVNYPTLLFKKTGFADTTFVLTSPNQTGISVTMRDTTTPKETACKVPPSANPGAGSFTNYWFSQGSYKEDGYYRTACGYRGTENSGQGSTMMYNIAYEQYFVAIPGNSPDDFNTNWKCGGCVELTGQNGTKIIATVTDECPVNGQNAPCRSNFDGHLDVSYPAFSKLGFSVGNPSGTNWKFVPCPVKGSVIIRVKKNNSDQIYIENTILPVKDVKVGTRSGTHLTYGAWQLSRVALGATVTIVDYSDRSITVTIPVSVGADKDYDTKTQFPACK